VDLNLGFLLLFASQEGKKEEEAVVRSEEWEGKMGEKRKEERNLIAIEFFDEI
jgi:hypothetical protein